MKLAEALQLRGDLQKRLEQLSSRLYNNATVQEGEAPAEDPAALLEEYEDGSFYMGDYIWEENRYTAVLARENKTVYRAGPGERTGRSLLTAAPEQSGAVAADNLQGKRLKEIHFDRVYYR